jgi:hypothetical protein
MNTLCALAIALSLSPAQAPPKLVADADLRELSTYTLTMENVNKFARINAAMLEAAKQDPRYAEQVKLKAELEALRKKDETTEAEDKRMEAIQQRLETLESQDDDKGLNMSNAKNLDEMAASIQAFPPMMAALRKEGLTAREYAKFMLAMLQAGFAAGLQKAGMLKTTPEGVNPANIKFVIEHEAELKKLQPGGGGMQ